jgi:riboflavin synthase
MGHVDLVKIKTDAFCYYDLSWQTKLLELTLSAIYLLFVKITTNFIKKEKPQMFTGIVTDMGQIVELEQRGDLKARIKTNYDTDAIDIGASIACDGVCLTVIALGDDWFDVEISAETVSVTNLGRNQWYVGKMVNLERALRLGDELGGHIVSGHVDGVAELVDMRDEGDSTRMTFQAPAELARFIAPKGSVTLNGTSLTVNEVNENTFGINLVPHTKQVTTWGQSKVGDPINLEIDTLARYVARLAEYHNA